MVKVILIAIIKIYVEISAIEASAKVKSRIIRLNPRHASESTEAVPLDQSQLRLQKVRNSLLMAPMTVKFW